MLTNLLYEEERIMATAIVPQVARVNTLNENSGNIISNVIQPLCDCFMELKREEWAEEKRRS